MGNCRFARDISILAGLLLLMGAPEGLRADENRYGLKAHLSLPF